MNILKKVYRLSRKIITDIISSPKWLIDNLFFVYEHRTLKEQPKIIYSLTPPPYLKNVGDHAQVIAIRAWLDKHFCNQTVLEMDKDQGHYFLPALRWLVNSNDIIFLHSGGNLGDRGIWSEGMRREIISNFPQNQIVSLPQTIFFSDTEKGQKEQENSRRIYAKHPNLTVIGRDPRSGELAAELFSQAQIFCMPDFVLSLPPRHSYIEHNSPKLLLCLRLDPESVLTSEQRLEIGASLPYECTYYDTTIDQEIVIDQREAILDKTLDKFLDADIVVTDRYHGLIFTVLCQKPCVVLQTIDHKLTSAIHWFEDLPQVMFAQNLDQVPELVERCLKLTATKKIDWSIKHFNRIPELVNLESMENSKELSRKS